jgi:hypothetical protein
MTMRPGGAFGLGVTSKGESIVGSVAVARERARRERIALMADENRKAKAQDAFSATPGARARGTHKVEQPLQVGPPDALIEETRTDHDLVPEMESKGYHTGVVRQPVSVAADARGNVVGFTSEHPSKFAAAPTLEDLKAYHNEVESGEDWQEDVQEATPVLNEDDVAAAPPWARASIESTRSIRRTTSDVPDEGEDEGELKGEALDEAGKAAGIEGWSGMTADEKRAALKAHDEGNA